MTRHDLNESISERQLNTWEVSPHSPRHTILLSFLAPEKWKTHCLSDPPTSFIIIDKSSFNLKIYIQKAWYPSQMKILSYIAKKWKSRVLPIGERLKKVYIIVIIIL